MARRKRTSTAEDVFGLFHEIFMDVPAWLCLPVAAAGFVGVKFLINKLAADGGEKSGEIGRFENRMANHGSAAGMAAAFG